MSASGPGSLGSEQPEDRTRLRPDDETRHRPAQGAPIPPYDAPPQRPDDQTRRRDTPQQPVNPSQQQPAGRPQSAPNPAPSFPGAPGPDATGRVPNTTGPFPVAPYPRPVTHGFAPDMQGCAEAPRARQPWVLVAVAFGCVVALLLSIGGGITYLALSGGEDPTAGPSTSESESTNPPETTGSPTTSEAPTDNPTYQVISPVDAVNGTPDQIWATLETSPLTEGTVGAIGSCDLPETPVDHTPEQLQTTLDAAGACLNRVWATAHSDRNLPWLAPTIVVFTWPEIPSTSACEPDTFEEGLPRQCNLDSTLYWPVGAGHGADQTDPKLIASTYMWDLAYHYMSSISWNTGLWRYYQVLDERLEGDTERQDDAWRRYILQMMCLSSLSSVRVPEASRPPREFRDALSSEEHWTPEDGSDPGLAPASRAHWIKQGFDSEGDLTSCNTWEAPEETVA